MNNIERFVELIDWLHEFDQIYRKAPIRGREQMETDSEHSYKLAMTSWYILEKFQLNLNLLLVLKYALAHDLVEIQAGDTDSHNASEDQKNSKQTREHIALQDIKSRWYDFTQLHTSIEDFENRINPEAEFVYLMDKIQPVINTLLAKNQYYVESKVSYVKYTSWLDSKTSGLDKILPEVNTLITELKDFLRDHSEGFFYKD